MSANLLDGLAPILYNGTTESEGTYYHAAFEGKFDILAWRLSGQKALAANQTVHLGLSLRGASADASDLHMVVAYVDGAGNYNWAWGEAMPVGTSWGRAEATVVIPSGMTMTMLTVSTRETAKVPEVWMAAPTLSLGSPVCLASSAHTPYATQDHVMATYATKASLKVTDDSVKAEVSARAQTDRNVADLSSRLTQTANSLTSEVSARTETDRTVSDLSSRLTQTASGLSASISKLSETDEKVNSWFDFEADSSGNPQLKMGSSASPVVGTYTNTGMAYKARSGATLMELDASSQSSTLPHMHADDVSIGNWQWMPTQNGTHLTLMWIGG